MSVLTLLQEKYYVPAPEWVEKLLQLYQIQLIRHGMMMVGPSGSGKTASWKVLLQAMEVLAFFFPFPDIVRFPGTILLI
jgi:dynein heavy chain 1